MEYMLETKNLTKNYQTGKEEIEVIKGVDLQICPGEYVSIMGASGCGKTTLLKTLGLLKRPTDGELFFKGNDTSVLWKDELADIRRREIGFVFQNFNLMESITAGDNIMLPMILDKASTEVMKAKTMELAERLEVSAMLHKRPGEMSGGQQQRIAICRALVNNPDLILADEPTGNLDSKSGRLVMEMFDQIHGELKKTIVMVTHDPSVASRSEKVLFMRDGVIGHVLEQKGRTREEFYNEIIKTQSL